MCMYKAFYGTYNNFDDSHIGINFCTKVIQSMIPYSYGSFGENMNAI